MNSNSKRLQTQIFFEQILGCPTPDDIKDFQDAAPHLMLNGTQAALLREHCETDARSFLSKGLISILSAVSGLSKGRETWPVVQLYYANYYLLRAELLMRKRCILRANRVFTVLCQTGQKVERVSNRKKQSDHDLTIMFAKRYLDGVDVLLTQTIEEKQPYEWMQNLRNWHQYKNRNYIEISEDGPFFSFEAIELYDQVKLFLDDPEPYYCFDPDYAALALPIKRLQLTLQTAEIESLRLTNSTLAALRRFGSEGLACERILQLLH